MFIEIKGLEKYYGVGDSRVRVLNELDFQLEKGYICTVLGPSGSGKSTLLNILGGIEVCEGGQVTVDDVDITQLKGKDLLNYRKEQLGFVFQFYNLIPNLTVKENIEIGRYISDKPLELDQVIDTLGLTPHKDKFPTQLSGGQQQRCSIGRAIIKNPKLLLFDEPTGSLDYHSSKELLSLIENINEIYGTTMIIVTHNEAISNMANRITRIHDGVITESIINENVLKAKDVVW